MVAAGFSLRKLRVFCSFFLVPKLLFRKVANFSSFRVSQRLMNYCLGTQIFLQALLGDRKAEDMAKKKLVM